MATGGGGVIMPVAVDGRRRRRRRRWGWVGRGCCVVVCGKKVLASSCSAEGAGDTLASALFLLNIFACVSKKVLASAFLVPIRMPLSEYIDQCAR